MAIIPKSVNPDFFPRGGGPRTITLPDGTVIPVGPLTSCPALNEEVLLADKSWILAKDLKVGDEVATHLGSNKVTYIDVLKNKTQKEVIFTNGEKENSIVTSDTHPYYVENEQGFVEVKDLKIGDKVGEFSVKEIKDAGKGSVAHISIDEAQTYFLKAGDEAVLSHNKMPVQPKTPRGPKGPTVGGGSLVPPPRRPIPRGPGLPIKNPLDDFPFGRRRRGLAGLFGIGRKPMKPRRKGFLGKGISGLLGRLKEKMPMVETMQEKMMMPMRGGMMDVDMKEMRFPRMMMADGDEANITDFLDADPKQIIFGIEAQINNLMGEYEMALRNGEMARAEMLNNKINELDKMKIELVNKSVPAQAQNLRQMYNEISLGAAPSRDMGSGRIFVERDPEKVRFFQKEVGDLDQMFGGVGVKGYAGGGEASFPDLTGDNKVTQADILKGRGVFAEGDEVSMMMMEMEGDEDGMQEEAIKQLEAARPEFEMMQQLAQVVINLLEQGASEAEIVAILKEQGLDDEDIQTLLEFVNEMMGQAEQAGMAEEGIDSQLAALG